ncbi:hypothetical protein AAHZ94_32875, partial [Streptomyces sp. HSW2009]
PGRAAGDEPAPGAPTAYDRYALAAGAAAPEPVPDGLLIAHGSGGTDWRRYPPGLVDASERAVSWRAVRAAGHTVIAVSVAAAPERLTPGAPRALPPHLVPWAEIGGPPVTTALTLAGDAWTGRLTVPEGQPVSALKVGVYLPGFDPVPPRAGAASVPGDSAVSGDTATSGDTAASGDTAQDPGPPDHDEAPSAHRVVREKIRSLVRDRLARATAGDPGELGGPGAPGDLLAAERAAAAEQDDDY